MKSLPDDALDADRPLVVFLADDTDAEDHAVLFPLLRERGITARRVHPHALVIRLDGVRARHGAARPPPAPRGVGDQRRHHPLPRPAHLPRQYAALRGRGAAVSGDHRVGSRRAGGFRLRRHRPVGVQAAGRFRGPWPAQGHRHRRGPRRGVLRGALRREPGPRHPRLHRQPPGRVRHVPLRAGGTIAPCPLTPEIAELAERASRGAGTLIGGVDVGENTATGGLVVYEVDSCPTCEPPVLHAVADFLAATVAGDGEHWRPERDYAALEPTFHASKQHLIR